MCILCVCYAYIYIMTNHLWYLIKKYITFKNLRIKLMNKILKEGRHYRIHDILRGQYGIE